MAFTEIPTNPAYPPIVASSGGGYNYDRGSSFGSTALAAGVGAAVGGAIFGDGFGGRHSGRGEGHLSHEVLLDGMQDLRQAIPEQTIAIQHELFDGKLAACTQGYQAIIANMQCCCDIKEEIAQSTGCLNNGIQQSKYDNLVAMNTLDKDICAGFYNTNTTALQNKYENALQLCGIDRHIDECCCEEKELIMKMGYDTQLRDLCYKNDTDKQLGEIKCLIKDTAKDQTIGMLTGKIAEMSQCFQTRDIRDCIKDTFCKTSSAINQLGVNDVIANPLCQWPPYIPSACC